MSWNDAVGCGVAPREPARVGRELWWLAVEWARGVERRAAPRRRVDQHGGARGRGGPRYENYECSKQVSNRAAAGVPPETAAETDDGSHSDVDSTGAAARSDERSPASQGLIRGRARRRRARAHSVNASD